MTPTDDEERAREVVACDCSYWNEDPPRHKPLCQQVLVASALRAARAEGYALGCSEGRLEGAREMREKAAVRCDESERDLIAIAGAIEPPNDRSARAEAWRAHNLAREIRSLPIPGEKGDDRG